MYDDLAKRLRDAAKMSEALAVLLPHSEGNATAKLYNEAADAIEELSKIREEQKAQIILMAAEEEQQPRWIPVSDKRKYVAVSIKHTDYHWKFGMPCWLWGFHQTEDDEPRCFASYTQYPDKAERYALGDFKEHGYGGSIKDDEPVKLTSDFCKKWKKYDTVLVDAEQYEAYCRIADLPLEPPEKE